VLASIDKLIARFRRRKKGPQSLAERDEAAVRALRAKGVRIGEGCRIYSTEFSTEPYLVTIGNNVGIAGGVKVVTHNGAARLLKGRRPAVQNFGRVTIGDRCFIGENAILLPGTAIGSDSIVGAGAVVTGIVPENSLVVGNPAKRIGRASLYLERLARSPHTLDTFDLPEDQRRRAIEAAFSEPGSRSDRGDSGSGG
jgi:acetyltransferase-like isoleucine patch superfamily enzyme